MEDYRPTGINDLSKNVFDYFLDSTAIKNFRRQVLSQKRETNVQFIILFVHCKRDNGVLIKGVCGC
jgi:hypothetical protein